MAFFPPQPDHPGTITKADIAVGALTVAVVVEVFREAVIPAMVASFSAIPPGTEIQVGGPLTFPHPILVVAFIGAMILFKILLPDWVAEGGRLP
jgi:hypothetical protein